MSSTGWLVCDEARSQGMHRNIWRRTVVAPHSSSLRAGFKVQRFELRGWSLWQIRTSLRVRSDNREEPVQLEFSSMEVSFPGAAVTIRELRLASARLRHFCLCCHLFAISGFASAFM